MVAVHLGEVVIAQAPVIVSEGVLRFHLARGNGFLDAARAGAHVKAVFSGPDAYVSPDWYESQNQVPTWNYVSVYAEGPMRLLSDEELTAQIDALSAEHEARLAPKKPWTRAKMAQGSDARLLAAIEGVELRVTHILGKYKLSQSKSAADVARAAAALEALGRADLASQMRSVTSS